MNQSPKYKTKSIKFVEENITKNLQNLRRTKISYRWHKHGKSQKNKNDKLDFIKI